MTCSVLYFSHYCTCTTDLFQCYLSIQTVTCTKQLCPICSCMTAFLKHNSKLLTQWIWSITELEADLGAVSQGLVPALDVLMTAECLVEPVKAAACSIHSASGMAEEDGAPSSSAIPLVWQRSHVTHRLCATVYTACLWVNHIDQWLLYLAN